MNVYLTEDNHIVQLKTGHDIMTGSTTLYTTRGLIDRATIVAKIVIDDNAPDWIDWSKVKEAIKNLKNLVQCNGYTIRAIPHTHNTPFTVEGQTYTKTTTVFDGVELVPDIQVGFIHRHSIEIGRIERQR